MGTSFLRRSFLGIFFLAAAMLAASSDGSVAKKTSVPSLSAPSLTASIIRDVATVSVFYCHSIFPKQEGLQVCDSYGLPIDWAIVTFPYGVQGSLYWVKKKITEIHRLGKLAVVYTNAGDLGVGEAGSLGEIRPDLVSCAAVDIDGRKISRPAGQSTMYTGDLNEAAWRNFLRAEIRTAIAAGADGVCLDCIGAQAPLASLGGVFNTPDMLGFREFLRQAYSAGDLLSKFGIADINVFDYGEYIRSRNLSSTWKTRAWEVPLYWQFYVYEARSVYQVLNTMLAEAREFARSSFGRDIIFTGNTSPGFDVNFWYEDLLDLGWVEYPYHVPGYPPLGKSIPSFKLKVRDQWKKGTYVNMTTNAYDLQQRGQPSNIAKIWIAEAYAAQSEYQVPFDVPALPSGAYSPDLSVLSPYYQFIADHGTYFGAAWSVRPRVGVLYPVSSYIGSSDNYQGTALALFDAGVQFDVLFSGDDRILENRLTLARLRTYPVLILGNTYALTARQIQIILDYVRDGGTVVGWGFLGYADEFDDWSLTASLPAEWRDFWTVGTHALGSGRFLLLTQSDLGNAYYHNRSAALRDQIVQAFSGTADAEATSTAGDNVNFLAYSNAANSKLVIHMLNYNYNINSDAFATQGFFTLSFRLPYGFSMSGKSVRLISPDFSDIKTVTYSQRGQIIDLGIPSLAIYNLLVIE